MKRYKLILDIGTEQEKIEYFQNLTIKRIREQEKVKSYVLLWWDGFFKKYIPIDHRTNKEELIHFNRNIDYYCN